MSLQMWQQIPVGPHGASYGGVIAFVVMPENCKVHSHSYAQGIYNFIALRNNKCLGLRNHISLQLSHPLLARGPGFDSRLSPIFAPKGGEHQGVNHA